MKRTNPLRERDRYSSEYYIVFEIGGYIVYGRESKHRI